MGKLLPLTIAAIALLSCDGNGQICEDDECLQLEDTALADDRDEETYKETDGDEPTDDIDTDDPGTPAALRDDDNDGWTPANGDCNDNNAAMHPNAIEICDGFDNDCNGAEDDGLGHQLVQESDYGADGVPDIITFTLYNNMGQLTGRQTDSDGDGVIDSAESYYYVFGALGLLLHFDTDEGPDGNLDERKTYIYDGNGLLLGYEIDVGIDGILDRIDTYIYDGNGVRIAWEMDTDANGVVNTRYNYEYDANGTLDTMVIERFNGEGLVTSTMIYDYLYDQNNMIETVWIDLTADGIFDNETSYAYDNLGRLLDAMTDIGMDGELDTINHYVYNTNGDLEKIEIDSGADGTVDTRITRWEECWN